MICLSDYRQLHLAESAISVMSAGAPVFYHRDEGTEKIYLFAGQGELLQVLHLENYAAKEAMVALNLQQGQIAVWRKTEGLTLWNFAGEQLFSVSGAVWAAQFDPAENILWVIERKDSEQVIIMVYDSSGAKLAALPMEDELYESEFLLSKLPEAGAMSIDFGGGQDGSQNYFFSYHNGSIALGKTLPAEQCFLFCVKGNEQAILADPYDMALFCCSYPELEEQRRFLYPNEEAYPWCMGSVGYLGGQQLILGNAWDMRYYLFDLATMRIEDEIVIAGFAPTEDKDGEICSCITSIAVHQGRLLITLNDGAEEKLLLAEWRSDGK